ncbi:MAG: glycogen debranching enzyme, partial [Actinobacteria bacterium]|nr:glycogen debranching enzyme [Actinomycetota bacterium]
MEVWPGDTYPLGATPTRGGTNFAIFTEHGEAVELCLFDDNGHEDRYHLEEARAFVWSGFVPHVGAGQRYGYRVHGAYSPNDGLRFNPNKLLLDPYAKAIDGDVDWGPAAFGYEMGSDDLSFSDLDDAALIPRCVVVDDTFEWHEDRPLRVPWHQTVIYETHVKG